MDKDHPNADVRPVKDEINPEGASFDLLFGVGRAFVVIVVFHSLGMEVLVKELGSPRATRERRGEIFIWPPIWH